MCKVGLVIETALTSLLVCSGYWRLYVEKESARGRVERGDWGGQGSSYSHYTRLYHFAPYLWRGTRAVSCSVVPTTTTIKTVQLMDVFRNILKIVWPKRLIRHLRLAKADGYFDIRCTCFL